MVLERDPGMILAHPSPGEEIVVSGMAGRFPESDNIHQYLNNMYNKVDMITDDNRRWCATNPEIPHRTGKVSNIEKMDAGYFGLHCHQTDQMDPIVRQILERSYEAIVDAGYNSNELRNTRTGVFIGACFSETEISWLSQAIYSPSFNISGCLRSMAAQQISHHYGFEGPAISVDTACSSSIYAFEHAYRAIREGKCDSALVGGVSLCLNPSTSLQFARLGVLSMDGVCKAFDENANGYARSETIAIVLLQKAKNARRIYAQVVHSKTNSDGFKEQGITFPSSHMQKVLLEHTYRDCNIDPSVLDVLEAHATGTKVGDPEEMNAMDQVFCTNRKTPLLVGSVKSYLGHAEGASGMCSLVKSVIGLTYDVVLPNINYKTPRRNITALVEGRMVVPTDPMPWPANGSGLTALNSFGFGGSNAHLVLKKFHKPKVNDGVPSDDLPRLICVSGRTNEGVDEIFADISKRQLDAEYTRLLQQISKDTQLQHPYRGYLIHSKHGELERSSAWFEDQKQSICIVFTDISQEIVEIGAQLLEFPLFATAIKRIDSILATKQVSIMQVVESGTCKNPGELVLANAAIQIAITDVLKELHVPLHYAVGKSIGELSAAYAGGTWTLEQAVWAAYYISLCMGVNNGENGFCLSSALRNKKMKLSQYLEKIVPESANFLQRLLQPVTFSKTIWSNVTTSKLAVIILGSQNVETNGYSYLRVSALKAVNSLLKVLGSIYMLGYTIHTEKLYPHIEWPVSERTPMISPLIRWNYEPQVWNSTEYKPQNSSWCVRPLSLVNKEIDWSFLPGHVIDGLILMPATGYLYMVWETYNKIESFSESETRIIFENVKFHQATHISKNSSVEFRISLMKHTHKFEIEELGNLIVSGNIYAMDSIDKIASLPIPVKTVVETMYYKAKDVYKELMLRGYHYSGAFRAIDNADLSGVRSFIKWESNWIGFMDNMLQTKLLREDTRSLYVPTFIQKIVIDAPRHIEYVNSFGETPLLPVYNHKEANLISCGGIEIRGMFASPIFRRKARGEPVLETYKFIPFKTALTTDEAMRVFVQIFLENSYILKVKVVEVLHEDKGGSAISPSIQVALNDQPVIKSEVFVFGKEDLVVPNIKVVDKNLSGESQCSIIVLPEASTNALLVNEALSALKESGVIISRECANVNMENFAGLDVVSVVETDVEVLVLLRKAANFNAQTITNVILAGDKLDWMRKVQNAVKHDEKAVFVVQNQPLSGILGFMNCLRREPGGMHLKCLFIMDQNVHFDVTHPIFSQQIKKGLAVNIFKNGTWGTYRHLLLKKDTQIETRHIFINQNVVGNLSSLCWVEGSWTDRNVVEPECCLVNVYCSSVNFKDIMLATGKISTDAFTLQRLHQTTMHGSEYAGIDDKGRRVMGIVPYGGLASMVKADTGFMWEIPEEFSLEDAATIPITYGTVLYGLVSLARIKSGESILIHAGTGGIGLAAINIALFYKCKIFTTVGTEDKREFIRECFPQIPENHIGNSRDSSFEQMVFKQTKGRGVDIVLNSLVAEKLQASVRCLVPGGRFIEIGKYDLYNNNLLALSLLSEGRTYAGVMLDLFYFTEPSWRRQIIEVVRNGLQMKAVKPLHRVIFQKDEVEQAYRFMATGKHMGKILVRIREEHESAPMRFTGLSRFYGDPYMTYVIIGGLGGIGLELVDWLIVKGARKFVLVSRTGIKNGYSASRIRIWQMYEALIDVATDDVTTRTGCVNLLTKAATRAPVVAIFNLAVVLRDGVFENQTEENFTTALAPKALATHHLDVASRVLCPSLKHFVVFSSVACGRGNIGQTNYAMANSTMERICEKRKEDCLPGLAIQWGLIGEVGLVAEMQELQREIEIGGTLQQRVASCFSALETFLTQDDPIVSSMVVAEKISGAQGAANIIDVIKNIMGITDLKTISEHATLPELGMDSMTAVEIKQTLERECEVFLNAKDIRTLTFSKLKEILANKLTEIEPGVATQRFNILHRFISDEAEAAIPIKRLPSLVQEVSDAPTVFLLPGIEGTANMLEPLASKLSAQVYCLQYVYNNEQEGAVEKMAQSLLPYLQQNQEPFNIVAYSYGCIIALEVVSQLESEGRVGNLVLIDGSLEMLKTVVEQQIPNAESGRVLETVVLTNLMNLFMPSDIVEKHEETIFKLNTLDDRINFALSIASTDTQHSKEYQRQVCMSACLKMKSLFVYKSNFEKIKSKVILFKPSHATLENYAEDYKLQKLCENTVSVNTVEGNHHTIVKNIQLANAINDIISCQQSSVN